MNDESVLFQSTRPVRGATLVRIVAFFAIIVSIHAPRAGRDRLRTDTLSRV